MVNNENLQLGEIDKILSMILSDCMSVEDNPWWHAPMHGTYSGIYWRDDKVELDTLEHKMESWEIVDHHEDINIH